jgi:hypothetical protein
MWKFVPNRLCVLFVFSIDETKNPSARSFQMSQVPSESFTHNILRHGNCDVTSLSRIVSRDVIIARVRSESTRETGRHLPFDSEQFEMQFFQPKEEFCGRGCSVRKTHGKRWIMQYLVRNHRSGSK